MTLPMTRSLGLLITLFVYSILSSNPAFSQAGSKPASAYGDALAINLSNPNRYMLDGAPVSSDLVPSSLIKLNDSEKHIVWVEMEKGLLHLMVPNDSNGQW
jgi:hypothetical protein